MQFARVVEAFAGAEAGDLALEVRLGLSRMVALHRRLSALYQIHADNQYLSLSLEQNVTGP